jgi:hypothetical protein
VYHDARRIIRPDHPFRLYPFHHSLLDFEALPLCRDALPHTGIGTACTGLPPIA